MENFKLWLRVWTLKVKSAETLFQRHSCNQNWLWTLTQAGEDTAVFGSCIVNWAEWEVDWKTSGQEMQLWKIWDTSPVQTVCTDRTAKRERLVTTFDRERAANKLHSLYREEVCYRVPCSGGDRGLFFSTQEEEEEEGSHFEMLLCHVLKKWICHLKSFLKLSNKKGINQPLDLPLTFVFTLKFKAGSCCLWMAVVSLL